MFGSSGSADDCYGMDGGYSGGYNCSSYDSSDSLYNCYFTPLCSASLTHDIPFVSTSSFFDFHPVYGS